jgi:16S rRNA G966 N2-methylase RsmD
LEVKSGFEILRQDVGRALRSLEARRVTADYVFVDPPYRMEDSYRQTLNVLSKSSLLRQSGLVIAEHNKRFDPGEKFENLRRYRKLEQGDAALSFYRLT